MQASIGFRCLLCVAFLLTSTGPGFGQGVGSVDRPKLADELHDIGRSLERGSDTPELRKRAAELEQRYLLPAPEDVKAYAHLLASPEYGIFRILPREVFDADGRMVMLGGGSYYSFSTRSHEYAAATDIGFSKGSLRVGLAGADYGAFVVLEGESIETIGTHGAVAALTSLQPARTIAEARKVHADFQRGVAIGGWEAVTEPTVKVGAVYVLRSIVYDESDMLVALTPTRLDKDGSLIVVWRLLRRFPTPDGPPNVSASGMAATRTSMLAVKPASSRLGPS